MLGPLTYLDIGLLGICFLSGLLAMYRGLTREALSIVSWALAALATLYFVAYRADIAESLAADYGQSPLVMKIAIGVAIFIVVLVVVHFITIRFSDSVLESRVGMIDRILGFGFGIVRGFLLIVIGYMFANFLFEEKIMPPWVTEAQSYPYIKETGTSLQAALSGLLPEDLKLPGTGGSEPQSGEGAPEGTDEPPPEATTDQNG
ncbi:MAG: CvpA family protein [Hyphomicrobiaceae bacterium]